MNGRKSRAIHRAARALGSKPNQYVGVYPRRLTNLSHRRVVKMLKREAVLLPVKP